MRDGGRPGRAVPGERVPARTRRAGPAGRERDGRRAQRHHGPVRVPALRGGPRPAAGLPHRGQRTGAARPRRAGAGAAPGGHRRPARDVITDNCRVHAAVGLLNAGDLAGLGPLLHASHASLRDDFEVSWPEADVAAEAAEAAGGLCARMMGGGFGGSVIALAPADTAGPREAIAAEYARRGWPPPRFLLAPPSAGARRLL